ALVQARALAGRGVAAVSRRAVAVGGVLEFGVLAHASDPRLTLGGVVSFEFSEIVYTLTDAQATVLAERLRNYAKGTLAADVERISELSGNPNWTDGALAVADFTEEVLVGNIAGPLPLAGKSAEATFWALRLMVD